MDIYGEEAAEQEERRMKDTERGIKNGWTDKERWERDEHPEPFPSGPSPLAEYSKQGAQQKVFFPEGQQD